MRLSPLFILPLLFTTWQTSFAATVDCSKIKTDAERLACFDNTSNQNESPVSDEQKSQWRFFRVPSKWDDSVRYGIRLYSDNQIDEGVDGNKYGQISILCEAQIIQLYFSITDFSTGTDDRLESPGSDSDGDDGFVRYRLDKEQVKTIEMDLEEPTESSIGVWSSEQSIPFIKEMFGHDKMLLAIDRSERGSTTLEFSIKGIEEAIKPLRKACNW